MYVKVDGQLDEIGVEPGETVKKGKVLAVLHNDDLELQIASKETQLKAKRAELETLRFATSDPKIREGIAPLEDDIAGIEAQLQEKAARSGETAAGGHARWRGHSAADAS